MNFIVLNKSWEDKYLHTDSPRQLMCLRLPQKPGDIAVKMRWHRKLHFQNGHKL